MPPTSMPRPQGVSMRLTFLGTGTARPLPDTAASGLLVETDDTAVLFDIGSGIASRVEATIGALKSARPKTSQVGIPAKGASSTPVGLRPPDV